MEPSYSIAIETSCRAGGVALGRGEELLKAVNFDASYRQATQLVVRLEELLRSAGLHPHDLAELYVSTGPGSFTGLRVGITVARTLAEAMPELRLVGVPTVDAVAENARHLPWENLGVALDSKDGQVYAGLFRRRGEGLRGAVSRGEGVPPLRPEGILPSIASSSSSSSAAASASPSSGVPSGVPRATSCTPYGEIVTSGEPKLVSPEEFLAHAPRPILMIGEALELVKMEAPGVTLAPAELNLPTPEGVWRVGRRLAAAGSFTDCRRLLPLYSRKPEAVRLWEKRHP